MGLLGAASAEKAGAAGFADAMPSDAEDAGGPSIAGAETAGSSLPP